MSTNGYDVETIRRDFPILAKQVYGKPLVYLDNGASAQKPRAVIDQIKHTYEDEYANVHRGVHYLSQVATEAMEAAREKVRGFVNAQRVEEIVFVRNATEGINLVASSWGRAFLKAGDEIVLTVMEHHSNIVPWQFLREEKGVALKVAPIADDGSLIWEEFEKLLSKRTKLVAITHVSNALGTVVPMEKVIKLAHSHGAKVLVDGCQAVPHMKVDVRALDADFYVFSGHKLYGPSGIGVLYGKAEAAGIHAALPGRRRDDLLGVLREDHLQADLPYKFEAGTPHISGAIALGAAIDYVTALGLDRIAAHEHEILGYATERLGALNDVRLFGTAPEKAAILSFTLHDIHPHDAGTILDREGIAVRTGHHCAQPVMERFGQPATIRASFGLYNTKAEVDALVAGLARVREIFG